VGIPNFDVKAAEGKGKSQMMNYKRLPGELGLNGPWGQEGMASGHGTLMPSSIPRQKKVSFPSPLVSLPQPTKPPAQLHLLSIMDIFGKWVGEKAAGNIIFYGENPVQHYGILSKKHSGHVNNYILICLTCKYCRLDLHFLTWHNM
jgi:hypothetical protein